MAPAEVEYFVVGKGSNVSRVDNGKSVDFSVNGMKVRVSPFGNESGGRTEVAIEGGSGILVVQDDKRSQVPTIRGMVHGDLILNLLDEEQMLELTKKGDRIKVVNIKQVRSLVSE